MIKTSIIVSLQYEAVHCWPGCSIEEVSFLRYPHRHLFYITLEKEVGHSDRDVEIICFKRKVYEYLDKKYSHDFESLSCEMVSQELLTKFDCLSVMVLEDNENGGRVYRSMV